MQNTTKIFTEYMPTLGITLIIEETETTEGEPISTEIKGFYYSTPNEEDTKQFYGRLKAVYS